jgi:hypothetical protein
MNERTNKQTNKQRYKQTNKQTSKQTNKQTKIFIFFKNFKQSFTYWISGLKLSVFFKQNEQFTRNFILRK